VASLIRTMRRALARLTVEPGDAKSAGKKPAPKRQRRKGGRSADTYRAAGRRSAILASKVNRSADRDHAKANPQPVALPRDDGKCRDQESARRLRQMARNAA
jgi:hypothetical protein